jgi:hypothetical protein
VPIALAARDAHAVDPFEIQVYDGTANAPGVPGLELHVNRVFDGLKVAPAPELPAHHQSHFTLEPSIGVTPWLELGGYFQTALRGDGTFDYAGSKLRAKLVMPEGTFEHLRLGVNFELSLLPERYDAGRWGSEVRPIVAWENERFLLAVNPIIGVPLAGDGLRDGPTFEPAAMAKVKIGDLVAVGVETYSGLGPMAHLAPVREQEHYVYEAVDLLALPHVEVNAGVGQGLTAGSNAFVAKLIVGYSWETAPSPSVARRAPPGSSGLSSDFSARAAGGTVAAAGPAGGSSSGR